MSIRLINAAVQTLSCTEWLWEGRIPFAAITIFDGDPGTGKSTLTAEITARITTGRPLYPSANAIPPGAVLLCQAEDDRDTTISNISAAGGDLKQVYFVENHDGSGLLLPNEIGELERQIVRTGAKLVVLDPVSAFIKGQSEVSIRRCTTPLSAMARKTECALVLVRHLRKSRGPVMQRGLGSISLVAAARSALLVAPDPNRCGQSVLVQYKSSLGALSKSLAFRLTPVRDGLMTTWQGESHCTLDDFESDHEDGAALTEAKHVLVAILAGGPVPADKATKVAARAGLTSRTLRRAKRALGVDSKHLGFGAGSVWLWSLVDNDAVRAIRDSELDELVDDLTSGSPIDSVEFDPHLHIAPHDST